MNSIVDYMTAEEARAYGYAASLSAANEPDRAAWSAACEALHAAEARAIAAYTGEVRLNRHGRPFGGVHPAVAPLAGYFSLRGVYSPE